MTLYVENRKFSNEGFLNGKKIFYILETRNIIQLLIYLKDQNNSIIYNDKKRLEKYISSTRETLR